MGQQQRRPGFLRWGEPARPDAQDEHAAGATEETSASSEPTARQPAAELPADVTAPADAAVAPEAATDSPFLQDLVGAMRGVAESSRETSLQAVRHAVDQRVQELTTTSEERTEELRRRSELDLNGIADWERSELERVRGEAEQRREARRSELERELAEHATVTDRDVAATRALLEEHERALDAFFAELAEITDPAEFVVAAKRMPPPPDLTTRPAAPAAAPKAAEPQPPSPAAEPMPPLEPKAVAATTGANGSSAPATSSTLADRLAELDRELAEKPATEPVAQAATAESLAPAAEGGGDSAAAAAPTASVTTATMAPAVAPPAAPATEAETSTAIVVKGLGSFGAITSFKQALERVDGIRGVTLSLGPTGDFVYRASHATDFDIVSAIRGIEGPNAAIEQTDGSIRVTIERPR